MVPLDQIIAETFGVKGKSKKVVAMYFNLIRSIGSEMKILLEASISDIEKNGNEKIARGIDLVRRGKIDLIPGFDGEYGKVKIFKEGEQKEEKQTALFN